MTRLPDPLSRRDRQRQTREALVFAARAVFARDGYHRASLDDIARDAGFSKGAVYSNFDGKAALFLAVMDVNMEAALADGGWDVFEDAGGSGLSAGESAELDQAMIGFALATLEFVAAAARDEQLAPEMGKRMRMLTGIYASMAEGARSEDDPLSAPQLGALLAALDQGAALLTLAGEPAIDQRALRAGMQRLVDPTGAGTAGAADGDAVRGPGALHDEVVRQRVAAALREGPGAQG